MEKIELNYRLSVALVQYNHSIKGLSNINYVGFNVINNEIYLIFKSDQMMFKCYALPFTEIGKQQLTENYTFISQYFKN